MALSQSLLVLIILLLAERIQQEDSALLSVPTVSLCWKLGSTGVTQPHFTGEDLRQSQSDFAEDHTLPTLRKGLSSYDPASDCAIPFA